MTAPHITQFSTDEEFAAYARHLADEVASMDCLTPGLAADIKLAGKIGYIKASTKHLSVQMERAIAWRAEQRTMLRDLSERRRSERRDARNEQND